MENEGVWAFRKTINGEVITKSTLLHYDDYPEEAGSQMIDYIQSNSAEQLNSNFEKIVMVEPDEDMPSDESEQLRLEEYNDFDLIYMWNAKESIANARWMYVLDLDNNVLEIYEGNALTLKDSPYKELQTDKSKKFINLLITFPISNIPKSWLHDIKIASLESGSDFYLEDHLAQVLQYHFCNECSQVKKNCDFDDDREEYICQDCQYENE